MAIGIKPISNPTGLTIPVIVANMRTAWENFKNLKNIFQPIYYTSLYGSFATLLTEIGTDSATVYVNSAVSITANTTIPSNISIVVLKGGSFAISSGITLTINGTFVAPLSRVFTGAGTVAFGNGAVKCAIPQWWGAVADSSTDCTSAIQAAIGSGAYRVYLTAGTGGYRVTTTLSIANKAGFSFHGDGRSMTRIYWDGSAGGTLLRMRGSWFCKISEMNLDGNYIADSILDMPRYLSGTDTNTVSFNTLDHLRINNGRTASTSVGLVIGDSVSGASQLDNLLINKCFIANAARPVTIKGNVTFNITFNACEFSAWAGIPTTVGVDMTENCGQIYFDQCVTIGSGATIANYQRDRTTGLVTFSNMQMESNGVFFHGVDDTAFANIYPVVLNNCTLGLTRGPGTFSTTNGSAVLVKTDLTHTGFYTVGQKVSGTGIPVGATIASISADTSITLSAAATATTAPGTSIVVSDLYDTTNGLSAVVTPNAAKFVTRQLVSGAGIPAASVIVSINAGYVVLSANATETTIATTVTIGGVPYTGNLLSGSSRVYLTSVSGISAGATATHATGIPAATTVSSVTTESSLSLDQNATATATVALTIRPNIIDYRQRGAFIIIGGSMNSTNAAAAYFNGPGGLGATGGLVKETGCRYSNVSLVAANCSQIHQTSLTGAVSLVNGRFLISASTGGLTTEGAISTQGGFTAGADANITGIITAIGATQGRFIANRSTNAAASDEPSAWESSGLNASGISKTWARIVSRIDDATNGSEDSGYVLRALRAGSEVDVLKITSAGDLRQYGLNQGRLIAQRVNNVAATSEPGTFEVIAPNASGTPTTWAQLRAYVNDATASTEDADWIMNAVINGTSREVWIAGSTGLKSYHLTGTGNRLVLADTNGLIFSTTLAALKVPSILTTNTTAVGNVLTGEDDLMTYSVPAATLAADGDSISITAAGRFALATVRLKAYFGVDLLFDTGSLVLGAAADWGLECEIVRTSATTQKAIVRLNTSSASLAAYADYTTPGRTLSAANIFKLTGEATLTNDIIQEMAKVRFEPA